MNHINKLILGTVQFGLNYGINNSSGKTSPEEIKHILEFAYSNGLNTLDTSAAYGDSEIAIGNSLENTDLDFKIISKYPKSDQSVETVLKHSLKDLNRSSVYGYLIHHFEYFREKPIIWDEIVSLKEKGLISKIGFSLYTPEQLEYLFENNINFDIVQFPYNIFDRQFEHYLELLNDKNIEVHIRSVFLQGLFFKEIGSLSEKLKPLSSYLEAIVSYCQKRGISIEQLALNYAITNPNIKGVLIGVDNVQQLRRNFQSLHAILLEEDYEFIQSIVIKEKELLNPVNW